MTGWVRGGFVAALLLGTAVSAYAGAAPVCTLKFRPHTLSTGSNPQTIVTGDFNRDGHLDFAHVDYSGGGAGHVSVFLGNGDGTFQAPATYATGNGPDGLALADVNGDGIPDLIVANDTGSSISVLPGNGDGTFGAHTDYATGANSFPHWVAVGDFNGDHAPDIAVANEGANTVGVFLNKGNGTFGSMSSFGVSQEPYSVAAGDFRHDGKIDLAVTGYYYSVVSVLLGNGDGTFGADQEFPTDEYPLGIAAGTFKGTSRTKEDVIVTNDLSADAILFLNRSKGCR